jgi:uncharacterized iron-regulated membrane protein
VIRLLLAALLLAALTAAPWPPVTAPAMSDAVGVLAAGAPDGASACTPCDVRGACTPAAAVPADPGATVPHRGSERGLAPLAGWRDRVADIPTPPPRLG